MANIISYLKNFFFVIVGLLRRMMCFKKKKDDSLLPIVISKSQSSSVNHQQMTPSNFNYTNQSQSCVQQNQNNFANYSSTNTFYTNTNYQNDIGNSGQMQQTLAVNCGPQQSTHQAINKEQVEEEPDFFKDMAPSIKRQKKIFINTQSPQPYSTANRFEMDPKAAIVTGIQTNELGLLDETMNCGGSWEDTEVDIEHDLSLARKADRERRLAEHQKIKLQKDMKKVRNQKSSLIATKLS